jgi:TonB family protein
MNTIKFLLITIFVFSFLAEVETQAQNTKRAKKIKNQKIEGPARQTICDGTPLPQGYYIAEQTTMVACLAANQTGRAMIIARIDIPAPAKSKILVSSNSAEKVSLAVKNDGSKTGQSQGSVFKVGAKAGTNFTCQKSGSARFPALAQSDKKTCIVSGGMLNSKATKLMQPSYPAAAAVVHAFGPVNVQVLIDESGNVVSASATNGHPMLRATAVQAARVSKFPPSKLAGQPVKVSGTIIYVFTPDGKSH